ncbi:MAG TPA: hypothetical protein VES67_08295 [Vicinamibacterales bacterium]|nr:hypothetical protein [Vicinamibacterales bacterium]
MFRHVSIVLLAVGLVVSSAACLGTVRLQQTLSPAFGDLTTVKLVELVDDSGVVLMRGTFSAPSTDGGKIERTAELTRPKNNEPMGEVEIDVDRSTNVSEEEVNVKAKDLPYPASLKVKVDGLEIAAFSTTKDGKVDLRVWRRVTAKPSR